LEYLPNRDGYDSDPEFHARSKDINYEFKLKRGDRDSEDESLEYAGPPRDKNRKKETFTRFQGENYYST